MAEREIVTVYRSLHTVDTASIVKATVYIFVILVCKVDMYILSNVHNNSLSWTLGITVQQIMEKFD